MFYLTFLDSPRSPLTIGSAFVAGLNNTIVQLIFLVAPETVAAAGPEDLFFGTR
jgi:hypothetical protein